LDRKLIAKAAARDRLAQECRLLPPGDRQHLQESSMARISEVMTRGVRNHSPRRLAAARGPVMDELNVGALPVCDGEQLVA
jgi:hypothetical protein